MFIVLLRFAENKGNVGEFMDGHNAWIKDGFDDGVFLSVGGLQPSLGAGIMAHNTTMKELQNRTNNDPFVVEKIVEPEILEITPAKVDERLNFLVG